MPAPTLCDKYPTLETAIPTLPKDLQELLKRHEAASLCSDWLRAAHPIGPSETLQGPQSFNATFGRHVLCPAWAFV
jgi:hypothetical protein